MLSAITFYTIDLLFIMFTEKMSTNIDVFFSTRPRNIHTFELYLNLLAFKKEYKQAIETLNLMKVHSNLHLLSNYIIFPLGSRIWTNKQSV